MIPTGGGTKLDWGNPPRKADVILSMRRQNRVIEHAWADLTVTVEAGCTIAELQRTLAEHGQRLAVDPLWPERATIGGILSTNDSGSLRLGYGALRDLIIGITLVLADGTIAKSGGKVVKNVAGYDLPKLATGAMGTLGVITRAVFRLHPLPRNTRTLTIAVDDADAMQRVVLAILGAQLAPAAVQAQKRECRYLVRGYAGRNRGAGIGDQPSSARSKKARPTCGRHEKSCGARAPIVKFTTLPSRIAAAAALFSRFVIQATGIGYAQFDGDLATLRSRRWNKTADLW